MKGEDSERKSDWKYSIENPIILKQAHETWERWLNSAEQQTSQIRKGLPPEVQKELLFTINHQILFLAAKSYVVDLARFKDYSGSNSISESKKASFTLKWLSRLKPIQIQSYYVTNDDVINKFEQSFIDLNFYLALECSLRMLNDINTQKLPSHIIDELIYNMTFRSISGRQYALVFDLIKTICQN